MGLKKLTATVASALVKARLFQIFSEKYAKGKDGLQHKFPLFLQSGSSGSSETESSTLPPQPSSVCHPVHICCWKSQSTLGSLGPPNNSAWLFINFLNQTTPSLIQQAVEGSGWACPLSEHSWRKWPACNFSDSLVALPKTCSTF